MALKLDIYLRRAERDDLDTVAAWREDPEFVRALYGDRTASPKLVREQIVAMLGRTGGHTVPPGINIIIDSGTLGPVGMFSIVNISWRNRSCNIDAYLSRKARHGMIGAASYYRVIEYIFEELDMHRVNLYVYAFNSQSWRGVARFGGQRELALHKHVARDGEYHDLYAYGILPEDWQAIKADMAPRFQGGMTLAAMIEQRRRARTEGRP